MKKGGQTTFFIPSELAYGCTRHRRCDRRQLHFGLQGGAPRSRAGRLIELQNIYFEKGGAPGILEAPPFLFPSLSSHYTPVSTNGCNCLKNNNKTDFTLKMKPELAEWSTGDRTSLHYAIHTSLFCPSFISLLANTALAQDGPLFLPIELQAALLEDTTYARSYFAFEAAIVRNVRQHPAVKRDPYRARCSPRDACGCCNRPRIQHI